ncbi:hypothetical protein Rs2_22034 [Raphanus sativus]|nr:hypothetical protein Rs2_22034 [Raphanus sativus]
MALRDFCHLDLIPYSNGEFHQYVDESMDSSSSEARSGAQVLSMAVPFANPNIPRRVCNYSCTARRNLHSMESVISIYKSLNAAVGLYLPQLQIHNSSNSPQDG